MANIRSGHQQMDIILTGIVRAITKAKPTTIWSRISEPYSQSSASLYKSWMNVATESPANWCRLLIRARCTNRLCGHRNSHWGRCELYLSSRKWVARMSSAQSPKAYNNVLTCSYWGLVWGPPLPPFRIFIERTHMRGSSTQHVFNQHGDQWKNAVQASTANNTNTYMRITVHKLGLSFHFFVFSDILTHTVWKVKVL